jgi:alkylation response protein AidB-like acyl-CoA dehydrogenase
MYLADRGFEMSSEALGLFGGCGLIHEFQVERIMQDTTLITSKMAAFIAKESLDRFRAA